MSRLPVLTSWRLPFEIREADKIRSQHLDEPRRTSAVLHVGPARLAYGRHVEGIARGDEAGFVRRECVGLRCILQDLVLPEVFVLGALHRGREHELHVSVSHGSGTPLSLAKPLLYLFFGFL